MSKKSVIHLACWILTICIMLLLTVSTLIKHGMFMDAMLYTSVSHNLSHGIGTFWLPYFDEYNVANLPSFHEQPPLAFGIQSLFFRLLGDSMYVERFYTFFTMCMNAFLIFVLWKEITKDDGKLAKLSWLPILCWITIPVCFWSYSNNMHENTMSLFTLGAVILSYKALQSTQHKWLYYVAAACLICCAALTKGFPGLFPIAVPFLYWWIVRRKTFPQITLYSLLMLLVMIAVGVMLYLYPESKQSMSNYLIKRAFQRINEAPSVDSRFFILGRLFSELIPLIALTIVMWLISRWKQLETKITLGNKQAWLFIAIGLSGSLPLMLTMVQNGFYFVAALPYFGIGFALLLAPSINELLSRVSIPFSYKLRTFGMVFLCVSLVFIYFQKDKFSRDEDLLHDVAQIANAVPTGERINCTDTTYQNWSLNCYLIRMHNISISNVLNDSSKRTYYLTSKNESNPDVQLFSEVPLMTKQYNLFKTR